MTLPAEKVHELKQIIHSHLSQMNVHSKIKGCLDDSFTDEDDRRGIDEATLLNALKERGIVDDVMRTLKFEGIDGQQKRVEKRRDAAVDEQPSRGDQLQVYMVDVFLKSVL